jgi:type I restriction enzyme, S subunit
MNVSTAGRIDRSVLKYVQPSEGRADLRLRRGDVLFNNTNSPELVGKTALFDDDDRPAFSNHMTRLRVDRSRMDPAYLALRLHQAWREGWFAAHCNNHVSQASISRAVLRGFEIEMPPLDVQRFICALSAATEGYATSADNHLQSVSRIIERFRQAALIAACAGRLTEEWRLGLDRTPEYVNFGAGDLSIPADWEIYRGSEIFEFVTSGSRGWARYYSNDGPLFLRVGNLDRYRIDLDLDGVRHVRPPATSEAKRTRVQPGDVLISITAEVGMAGVVPADCAESYVNQHVAIARPRPGVNSRYLAAFVTAPGLGESQLDALQRGATKAGLGLNDIRALEIPLPPQDEQDEIAVRLDALLAFADAVVERASTTRVSLEKIVVAVAANALRRKSGGAVTEDIDQLLAV